jgi:hypothetical protein
MPKASNHPKVKKSPNLVTLHGSHLANEDRLKLRAIQKTQSWNFSTRN